jgi:hypothetical protein
MMSRDEEALYQPLSFLFHLFSQAIDKLEDLLNGGMKSGQASMFGPREYVAIYT